MIIFEHIKWKNFLSAGNQWIELPLNENQHTLIVGGNGAGKSTILDAISFVLFGKAHRKIPKPNLVNSINKKNCVVELKFNIGSNNYKIIRGIAPAIFEIYVNDKIENQSSHAKEYQKILENNILKLNHKSFHQIVVLGSTSFVPFMQLFANQRREIIEDLLNISVFSKMNFILKEKRSIIKTQLNDLNHEIEIFDSNQAIHEDHIKKLKSANASQKKQKKDKLKVIDKDLEELEFDNKNLIIFDKDEYIKAQKNFDKNKNDVNMSINNITNNIKTLIKEVNFYKNNDTCPTCKTPMLEADKESSINVIKQKGKKLFEEKTLLEERFIEIEKSIEEVTDKLKSINEKESLLKINNIKIKSLEHNKSEIMEELKEFENSVNDIKDIENKLANIIKDKKEKTAELESSVEEYKYNKIIGEMLKDDGIKTKIVKQYIPVINKIINQYLEKLDFFARFTLDDSFNEEIKSRHLDSFKYESFSEGEKTKIDLSLLFTWREIAKMNNSVSTNLLILDETFDSSLDFDGVENLTRLLYDEGGNNNTFIISHKHELKDKFTTILEFFKRNNFSSYTQAT